MFQVVLACLLLAAVSVQGSEEFYSLEVTTIQGEKTTMADYKGKVSHKMHHYMHSFTAVLFNYKLVLIDA